MSENKVPKSVEPNDNHKDILGRDLRPGQVIAFSQRNMLKVGRVERLTDKMARIQPFTKRAWGNGYLKYGSDMVILEGEDVLMYVLKSGL